MSQQHTESTTSPHPDLLAHLVKTGEINELQLAASGLTLCPNCAYVLSIDAHYCECCKLIFLN